MKRKIQVFIASPGDLSAERNAFRDAIHQLNVGFGDGANVEFEALGWEDTLSSIGRRSQSVINEEIDRCDVFILTLYRRWGQEAPDAEPYSSYTEEDRSEAMALAVRPMIGVLPLFPGSSRIFLVAVMPSIFGICTSINTRSKSSSCSNATASSPSLA